MSLPMTALEGDNIERVRQVLVENDVPLAR